jgi:hypothetical protein
MTPSVYKALFISLAVAIVVAAWIISRTLTYLSASRQARAALVSDDRYRGLSDEYRRLSDLAITAQEHTDLRLADLSVQMDALREKLDQMQRILEEVE